MSKKIIQVSELDKVNKKLTEGIELEPVMLLELSKLEYPEFRTRSSINEKSLMNLIENIRAVGLLNPVIVRQKGTKYEIISGAKRVVAVQELGNTHISAFVLKNISDKEALLLSISDNLNRDDLNAFDQVFSMIHLMAVTLNKTFEEIKTILNRIDNFEKRKINLLTMEERNAEKVISEILAKFGRIRITTFIMRMKVVEIHPLLINAVRNKGLNYTLAYELNRVKDEKKMEELLNEVMDKNMPLKVLKETVNKLLGTPSAENPFGNIYRRAKSLSKLPKEVQLEIHKKIQEIESLMAG